MDEQSSQNLTNKQTKKKFFKQWWFWIIVALVILLIMSLNRSSAPPQTATNQPNGQMDAPEANDSNSQAPTAAEADYLDAYDIISSYVENTVAADAQYRDKTLEIKGVVSDIGKDLLDTPYLMIRGSKLTIQGLRCNFPKDDESLLAAMEKNQEIVIRGTINGEKLGQVIVNDCQIIEQ